MLNQKVYLTREGMAKIEREIGFLKRLRSSKVSSGPTERGASEDVGPEYLSFYQDVGMIDLRLAKLENTFKNALLIRAPRGAGKEDVRPGATVVVENGGRKNKFNVTGSFEADPAGGKISVESPVGSALLGHRAGDKIVIPDIKAAFRILSVSYPMA